jgi:DNA topoisomerase-3
MHTVFKEGANKGRKFWKCASDGMTCKFWEWDDEPPRSYGDKSNSGETSAPFGTGSSTSTASDVCFKVRF